MVWSAIFRADAAQDAAEPAPAPWLAPALQPSTLAALVALRHAALFRFVTPNRGAVLAFIVDQNALTLQ